MRRLSLRGPEFVALARELLARGDGVRFTAHGASMQPTIEHGDTVTVRPLGAGAPAPGALVLYQRADGRPVVHRVVACRHDCGRARLEVRGDAQTGAAEEVAREQILGEVVRVAGPRGLRRLAARVIRRARSFLRRAPASCP